MQFIQGVNLSQQYCLEYADWSFAEGRSTQKECPGYDTKLHLLVTLVLEI